LSRVIFSIIIPIYNTDNFIKYALNNILNQTFQNIEIICVDDGSTDNSLSLLEKYRKIDDRIIIIKQEHKGAAAARNKGLKIAKGDYISFVDSDDLISTNLYEKIFNIIEKEKFDIVMFNAGYYNNKTKKVLNNLFFNISGIKNHINEFSKHNYSDFKYLFYGNESVANKIYKRTYLQDINLHFKESSNFEDRLFHFLSFIQANSISVLNERLYLYRINRKNSMNEKIYNKNSKLILDIFNDFPEIEELIFSKYPNLEKQLYEFIYIIFEYYFYRAPFKIKNKFYKMMRTKLKDIEKNVIIKKNFDEVRKDFNTGFILKHNYIIYYLKQIMLHCINRY
jgi:glycosyltransferase involved in cell wall biosynthesis